MELEQIWDTFLKELQKNEFVIQSFRKNVTGIPFLYVQVDSHHISGWDDIGRSIIQVCSKKAMFKKKVTVETHFFRRQDNLFVYRHRFYVPQEKMFCCGNLCEDCIRLKKKA